MEEQLLVMLREHANSGAEVKLMKVVFKEVHTYVKNHLF